MQALARSATYKISDEAAGLAGIIALLLGLNWLGLWLGNYPIVYCLGSGIWQGTGLSTYTGFVAWILALWFTVSLLFHQQFNITVAAMFVAIHAGPMIVGDFFRQDGRCGGEITAKEPARQQVVIAAPTLQPPTPVPLPPPEPVATPSSSSVTLPPPAVTVSPPPTPVVAIPPVPRPPARPAAPPIPPRDPPLEASTARTLGIHGLVQEGTAARVLRVDWQVLRRVRQQWDTQDKPSWPDGSYSQREIGRLAILLDHFKTPRLKP